ncbi:threonine synthase, partial [Vibrio xuii]
RIEELCRVKEWGLETLGKGAVTDAQSAESVKALYDQGYLCEPHGAIAYRVLEEQLQEGETGLFLCTAHPAKFKEVVDEILESDIDLPAPLAKHAVMDLLSEDLDNNFDALKEVLRRVQK